MVIGSKNKIKGDIKFEGILRIDGHIEGRVIAPKEVQFRSLPNIRNNQFIMLVLDKIHFSRAQLFRLGDS